MLRIIHTADWHLGHTLHGFSRDYEHQQFLNWLDKLLYDRAADALIVAGDVFDSATPSNSALSMFFNFLAHVKKKNPKLVVIIIGGNHDSPARLEAPKAVLEHLGIKIWGSVQRDSNGTLCVDNHIVRLEDKENKVRAFIIAIPFLRSCDLEEPTQEDQDPLIAGTKKTIEKFFEVVSKVSNPEDAIILVHHCYMVGAKISELSERKILGGNQHALPNDIFPKGITYYALGHLHLAQTVGGSSTVRYSGSPIPLSMAETSYKHQVLQIDLHSCKDISIEEIKVPRTVELLRIPDGHSERLKNVLDKLQQLDENTNITDPDKWPFLEVRVLLDQPEPHLRMEVEKVLKDKPVRLVKITSEYCGNLESLPEIVLQTNLCEINPETVFHKVYKSRHNDEPPQELSHAFRQLLETVLHNE